jgi:hypothetical protein
VRLVGYLKRNLLQIHGNTNVQLSYSETRDLTEVRGQLGRFISVKEPRYTPNRRMDGSQGRLDVLEIRKSVVPARIRTQIVQPVAQSLH